MKTGSYGNNYFSVTWVEPVAGQTLELTASRQLHTADIVSTIYQHMRKYEQLNILLLITSKKHPSPDLTIMVIYSAYSQVNFLSYINSYINFYYLISYGWDG